MLDTVHQHRTNQIGESFTRGVRILASLLLL